MKEQGEKEDAVKGFGVRTGDQGVRVWLGFSCVFGFGFLGSGGWFFSQQQTSKSCEMLRCSAVAITARKSCGVGWAFAGSGLPDKRLQFFEWKFNEMTQTNTALS